MSNRKTYNGPTFMPYIADKDLFRAVSLAQWLHREKNKAFLTAARIAARKYGVEIGEVARYCGMKAGAVKNYRAYRDRDIGK